MHLSTFGTLLHALTAALLSAQVVAVPDVSQHELHRRANTSADRVGNFYNFWTYGSDGFDLTRGNATGAAVINTTTSKGPIMVNPAKSALVVIDMQNFFLHPNLTSFPAGLDAVQPTINLVHSFRSAGAAVIWCQWGLSDFDLLTMPPEFLYSFTDANADPNTTMGTEMGTINDNGTVVDMGRKLVRGSWNAQQFGPLFDLAQEGIAAGTDFQFPKNRLSCFWGQTTPGQQFVEDNLISTLFISGVNTDQCVFGTFIDAAYKGYDAILVQDASATGSPDFATEMVLFNANLNGFVVNSTQVIEGFSNASPQ